MRLTDFAKAAGVAALILVLNILFFGIIVLYFRDVHATTGASIARWSNRITGTTLLFGAAWLCGCRNRSRNAYRFAIALTIFYFLLVEALFFAVVGLLRLDASWAFTTGLELIGSLSGAFVAVRIWCGSVGERKEPA